MHEMALAEGILAVALDVSEQQRVHRIRVRVGALQRVVPDALRFSFALLTTHTPAEGAVLELQDVPARVRCRRCGAETQPRDAALACAACGAVEIEVADGGDVLVDAVQLDDGWCYRPAPGVTPGATPEAGSAVIQVPPEHLAWHALHDSLLVRMSHLPDGVAANTRSSLPGTRTADLGDDGHDTHSHGSPGETPDHTPPPVTSSGFTGPAS